MLHLHSDVTSFSYVSVLTTKKPIQGHILKTFFIKLQDIQFIKNKGTQTSSH